MELAVSLSLFASRVDEMSTTLRDDREAVQKALNAVGRHVSCLITCHFWCAVGRDVDT